MWSVVAFSTGFNKWIAVISLLLLVAVCLIIFIIRITDDREISSSFAAAVCDFPSESNLRSASYFLLSSGIK
jgi:hypothetical protein